MMDIRIVDFGVKDYEEVLKLQEKLFQDLVDSKIKGYKETEYVLIGEHLPVYTIGRRGKKENILFSEKSINESGAKIYNIGRGGDVTYHCPGQLIVYPLLDLERHKLGVKDFVWVMEEAVIKLLSHYNIKGERIEGATGVWIGKGSDSERKICAIGIKCSRFCTMHGLALNVNADLSGFSKINPCGFKDKGVTSIVFENKNQSLGINNVKKDFLQIFMGLIFPFKESLDFSK